MNKKYTYQAVFDFFQENGCLLLENEYINSRTPMKYLCVCGNESTINFSNFKKGGRCFECFRNKEKLSFEFVKNYFQEQGCQLLETAYVNSKTLMRYRCVCGNEAQISWNNFRKGRRCQQCRIIKISGPNNYQWIEDREAYKAKRLFAIRCRNMLRETLKDTKTSKINHTEKVLGYTFSDLQQHIENHPNWNEVKDGKWEIDHIFPIQAFLDYGIKDVKVINRLDNLQPLSSKDNNKKKDKYNSILFLEWLAKIGIIVDADHVHKSS